jgi:hypothetical protein
MESRLIFRHLQKTLKLSITQVAKVGEGVSCLIQALAHTFLQTGPFRPNNVNRKVPGLVFTGSSTLPGVGVPMVLVSGKLAAARVDDYAASEMKRARR